MAARYRVGIIAREPLANGFLTGKYDEDATFVPGDIRHHWPRPMIRGQVRAASALKERFARPDRTLAQTALKFVLAFPEVSVTIPGAKTPAHAEENLAASEAPDLSQKEIATIRELHARDFDMGG
jgi:aryl-alcohol dehydrogenase-like predicted oxidoreductase